MALTSYVALEQNFTSALGLQAPTFKIGEAASLFTSFNFLFTLSIAAIVVVGAGTLAYAGWERIQPSEQAVSKSNKIAKRAVLGTLGVLCLYVLLRTFNADLVTGDVGLEGLFVKPGVFQAPVAQPVMQQPSTPAINSSETTNRQSLQAAGISINKEPCGTRTSDCTNVANLQPAVMSMLIQLKDSCPGSTIVVTGGTEPGHKSHSGGRAVDVRLGNSALDSCIGKFNGGPPLGYCNLTKTGMGGFVFCNEKVTNPDNKHWHIYF